MWPGVHPRVGLPLALAGTACYGWLLTGVHPGAAPFWWAVIGLVALLNVVIAVRGWRRDGWIADALADRGPADPALAGEIDRLAGRVDDQGALSVWAPSLAVFFVASTGLRAAVGRGDGLFWVPVAGVVLYAVLATLLLRRRNRQVRRWLAERPREPDWRSVPPI